MKEKKSNGKKDNNDRRNKNHKIDKTDNGKKDNNGQDRQY
mgnify:CR=1 FL=1